MKVMREDLLGRLQSVRPGLAQREVLEQTSHLVFMDGDVVTFNDAVSCRVKSGLDKSFTGAVKATPLITLLEKIPDEELMVEFGDGKLTISGKRKKSCFNCEAEISLTISQVEKPGKWRPLPDEFDDAVKMVSACASEDESKFYISCVNFAPAWIEASDNLQIARYKIKLPISKPFLAKHSSLKELVNLGMVEISEGTSWVHFRNATGLQYSCRCYLEEFPDISEYLEVTGETLTLPNALSEAVDRAAVLSSENADEANKVIVDLMPGKFKVRGEGITGWFQETKSTTYNGPTIRFMIRPELLSEISKRHTECIVSEDRLKVDSDKFTYVACLGKTADTEE